MSPHDSHFQMTSNAQQIRPLSLNFEDCRFQDDRFNQSSSNYVNSNSFDDRSLFSGISTQTASSATGSLVTGDWQGQDNFCPDITNPNEPGMDRTNPYLPDMTIYDGQHSCNVDQIASSSVNGAIHELDFGMTFENDESALPTQCQAEVSEETHASSEIFGHVNQFSDLREDVGLLHQTIESIPIPIREVLPSSVQVQFYPQVVYNTFPPLPYGPSSALNAATYSEAQPIPALDRLQSLPIRQTDPPICKAYDAKSSKGTVALRRPKPGSPPHKGGRGRRTQKMTEEGRIHYRKVRMVGACQNCRNRKIRCDVSSILCRRCVTYFGANLVHSRCRQFNLKDISGILLDDRMSWHPGNRPLSSYFTNSLFYIDSDEYEIPLRLGFGPPMKEMVQIIYPGEIAQLSHHHVTYEWPHRGDQKQCGRSLQMAFPAKLSREEGLEQRIDNHLNLLIFAYFRQFPLYPSDLHLLREIYVLYHSLLREKRESSILLHQSLKLLLLVRISGEVTVDESDPSAQEILQKALDTPLAAYYSTHPCFIRSQLGRVFSQLARNLLSDILERLEKFTLSQNCAEWHVVFSTFAVLLMAVELVQYQDARISFHAALDGDLLQSPAFRFSERSEAIDKNGVDVLLQFFQVCFGWCNSRIQDESDAVPSGRAGEFLTVIRKIYNRQRSYLKERCAGKTANIRNMSHLLDRLVSRIFLVRPSLE